MSVLQQKRLLSFSEDLEEEEDEDKRKKKNEKESESRKNMIKINQKDYSSSKYKQEKRKNDERNVMKNNLDNASFSGSSSFFGESFFRPSSSSQSKKFMRIGELTQERFSLEREADAQRKKDLAEKEKLDLFANIFKYKQNFSQNNNNKNEANNDTSTYSSFPYLSSLFFSGSKEIQANKFTLRTGFAESQGMRGYMEDKAVMLSNFFTHPCTNLSYYAIFDGHNGGGASAYAQQNLHRLMHTRIQTIVNMQNNYKNSSRIIHRRHSCNEDSSDSGKKRKEKEKKIRGEKHDELCYNESNFLDINYPHIFQEAFNQLDNDYLFENPSSIDGTTALVCIQDGIYVHFAHIGDSRAVLGRKLLSSQKLENEENKNISLPHTIVDEELNKKRKMQETVEVKDNKIEAVRLTFDHKPDRPDETKRIKMHGGEIVHIGCPRVGIGDLSYCLAVSRAFGDFPLKQKANNVLICDPECNKRFLLNGEDEFIIMASDGLWDVCTDQDACNIVHNFLSNEKEKRKKDQIIDTKGKEKNNCEIVCTSCDDAAKHLIREALDRGTEDNVSCIILVFEWN